MNKKKNNRVVEKVTVSCTVPKNVKLKLDLLACNQGITRATLIRKTLAKEVKGETVGDPQYFTFEDLMNRYQVTRPAIYEWINSGKLRRVKIGKRAARFLAVDVDAFERRYFYSL